MLVEKHCYFESILHTSSITQSDPFTLNVGACRCPNISWLRGSFFNDPDPVCVLSPHEARAAKVDPKNPLETRWIDLRPRVGALGRCLRCFMRAPPNCLHLAILLFLYQVGRACGSWMTWPVTKCQATPQPLEMVQKHTETVCTLWLFNIAMENGPVIDGLPINTS